MQSKKFDSRDDTGEGTQAGLTIEQSHDECKKHSKVNEGFSVFLPNQQIPHNESFASC